MTLPYLPTITVQIAFNPTNILSSTQTWTDVSAYVRDFQTRAGRQHYLDRIQATSLDITFNNRTGFFLNGGSSPGNGTGYVIQPRLPIQVSTAIQLSTSTTSNTIGTGSKTFTVASGLYLNTGLSVTIYNSTNANSMTGTVTSYSGTTLVVNVTSTTGSGTFTSWTVWGNYPRFYGLIDSISEVVQDQLNIDLRVTASDFLKYLSLKRLSTPNFYPTYAKVASTQNYYRVGGPAPVVVTQAVGNGTTITYTGNNSFTAGQYVAIWGLQNSDGTKSALNLTGTIASATPTQFTITNGTTASAYNQNGVAYVNTIVDSVGANNNAYQGQVSFPTNGSLVYDPSNCTDLANGTNSASGGFTVGPAGNSGTSTGIDLWVNGANLYTASTTLTPAIATQTCIAFNTYTSGGNTQTVYLSVDNQGFLHCNSTNVTTNDVYVLDSNSKKIHVSDGQWHHVGVFLISGTLYVYCDGNFTSVTTNNVGLSGQWYIGGPEGLVNQVIPQMIGLVDEVVVTGSGISQTDVKNRWIAGGLLKTGQPVTANAVYSGDRIAEVLVLAGFGSISGGTLALNSGIYQINDNAYTTPYSSSNGALVVEPYYWDSPIYNSTCLDIILQVVDTDTGSFFQDFSGYFEFYNRNYYGTWSGTAWTTTYDTASYTPPALQIWTDDGNSIYNYQPENLHIVRDDADLWTTVRVSPQSGQEQIYETTSAEPRWGYSTLSKSGTVHASLADAYGTAAFLAFLYQSSLPRVDNVEMRARVSNGQNLQAMLNAELGDIIRFIRTAGYGSASLYSTTGSYPSQRGTISQNMIVESIIHTFAADPGDYDVNFVLDPYPLRPSGSAP